MIRFGLCCKFSKEPIQFRTTTATALLKMSRTEALAKVANLCLTNANALQQALIYCSTHRIGAFRINSKILPVKTHPDAGYAIHDLPDSDQIINQFRQCGTFAREHDIRLLFHPDQFILLSSENDDITRRSIEELTYQAEVAEWVGADIINIHGGGAYGNKPAALTRLRQVIQTLPQPIRSRLTLENDDRVYTPSDLLPVCEAEGIPLIYDVHHHRCLPDDLSIDEATRKVLATWNREPVFHLSSPKDGWDGPKPQRHHDYINPADFPPYWKTLDITVEIEAKAKELAIAKLIQPRARSQRYREPRWQCRTGST